MGKEQKLFTAKELAQKHLVKKAPNGTILKNELYLFEALKTKFGMKDQDRITEEEFLQKLREVKEHKAGGER